MKISRNIRRNALTVLYQLDCGATLEDQDLRASLDQSHEDAEEPGGIGNDTERQEGFELARSIWDRQGEADECIAALTPDWPTHRQPIIDRNLLRMGWFEITSGCTPPKLAINEAVELAREYSTTQSSLFVNGVLDRIYHGARDEPATDLPAPNVDVEH